MSDFVPVLYLKSSCPFCLKVAAYLQSIGVFDELRVRAFWPGDEREAAIRGELEGRSEKTSFPTLQFAAGEYMTESDAIIAHYAQKSGVDPDSISFFRYVVAGPMRRMREQFAEIRELKKAGGLDAD